MKPVMRRRSALGLLCLPLLLFVLSAPAAAQSGPIEDLSNFPQTSLAIESGKSRHDFTIWVADTPQREEQGLMFVRELPANRGMLFPLRAPRTMSMWMKNTYIELDMVFIGTDGRVSKIVERAVPQSLTTIDSGGPISAVLEIRGGEAARLGVHTGDRVKWK